eukprot:5282490-Amphidinium_carterae.2
MDFGIPRCHSSRFRARHSTDAVHSTNPAGEFERLCGQSFLHQLEMYWMVLDGGEVWQSLVPGEQLVLLQQASLRFALTFSQSRGAGTKTQAGQNNQSRSERVLMTACHCCHSWLDLASHTWMRVQPEWHETLRLDLMRRCCPEMTALDAIGAMHAASLSESPSTAFAAVLDTDITRDVVIPGEHDA